MKTGRILAGVVVLGVLLPSFPTSVRAQACCALPQAAALTFQKEVKHLSCCAA